MKKIALVSIFFYFTISPFDYFTPLSLKLPPSSTCGGLRRTSRWASISPLYAQVNLLEPLRPGLEGKIGDKTQAIILEGAGFGLGENYWELPFFVIFRPTADYEIEARVSIDAYKKGGKWTNGIGDILVAGKYLFFRESVAYPTIFGEAALSLPSGDFDQGFGTGAPGVVVAAGMERTIGEIHEHLFLNYRYNLENSAKYLYGNVFNYTAGIGFPLKKPVKLAEDIILVGEWKVFGELKGSYYGDDQSNGSSLGNARNELYLSAGAKYNSKWGRFALSLLLGLTKQSPSYRIYLSARY